LRPNNLFLVLSTSLVLVAACASPEPTATAVPPTAAPTRPAAAAAATTATPAPAAAAATPATAATTAPTATTVAASSPTAAAAPPVAATAGSAAATAGARAFKVDADQSEVQVRVNEQLADLPSPSDAVLTTKDIQGQIVVTREGKVVADSSKFTVGLDSLKSDRAQRDNFIKRSTLQTSQYPNAQFAPTDLKLNGPVPTQAGDLKGQLVGNMTIHGTTKPVTFDLDAKLDGSTVKGTANTQLKITDFGMTLPRVPVLLSIQDLAKLQINFAATAAG
jgi:polyisoprenoid-binding protein YceI